MLALKRLPFREALRLLNWPPKLTKEHKYEYFRKEKRQEGKQTDRSLSVGSETVQPSPVVRDMGVLHDAELSVKQDVQKVLDLWL